MRAAAPWRWPHCRELRARRSSAFSPLPAATALTPAALSCSPSQYFGPLRSYPAPCAPAALPPVHGCLISHSHYDHLDVASLSALWTANAEHLRFFVPLGLRAWFGELGLGIPEERVTEMDWWDEVRLYAPDADKDDADAPYLRIVCTPAQHGSGQSTSRADEMVC
jgi:L-ascorbate metabolism protein UlaG (beta-lactamase superfamily)